MLLGALAVSAGPGGHADAALLDGVRAVAVSPDGAHVYAASEFDDSVAVFRRSAGSGDLLALQSVRHAPGGPWLDAANSVALSPDGRHLYVAAFVSSAVNVFKRDPITGLLSFVEAEDAAAAGVDGLAGAHGAIVSPDGAHVYVAGYADDAIAVFARDPGSGGLSFVEAQRDGVGGVDGLAGILWVSVSPDGSHLYAAGAVDGAVAVFARDPATGALSFLQVLRNGAGGARGLDGARVAVVSPDGRHVYVASGGIGVGPVDHALVAFARDQTTGLLSFVDAYVDDTGDLNGLNAGYSIGFAAGGSVLAVASFGDNALAIFDRDAVSGALALRHVTFDGPAALGGAHAVAASPDDAELYVAAFNEPALAWFDRDPGTGAVAFAGAVTSADSGLALCPAAPPAGCREAARSSLRLKHVVAGDRIVYAWRHGAATSLPDFGDPPAGSTSYALCLYHAAGGGPVFLAGAFAPHDAQCSAGPGSCWRRDGRGLSYGAETGAPAGVESVTLRPGHDGQARVAVRAAGAHLPVALRALPLAPPVTALVVNSQGGCWRTTFEDADLRRNDVTPAGRFVFKAIQ